MDTLNNKVYVVSYNDVTVIDGATQSTVTLPVAGSTQAIAVNPATRKVYILYLSSNLLNRYHVAVIDGEILGTSTIANDPGPSAVAVNPLTNKVYTANSSSNSVTVADGDTTATKTVAAGTGPAAVAVNTFNNKVYVPNTVSNNLTVIDGATDATTTIATGSAPIAVAVNPVTNRVYTANSNSNNVTVIDGATNATSTVSAGINPAALDVNPVSDKIYVANEGSNNVTVIDGASNATTSAGAGTGPVAVAVNPISNKIYTANRFSDDVTVIDGETNVTTTVIAGKNPVALAVNPAINKIYVANQSSNNVTVIDGATNLTKTVAAGIAPNAVSIDPATSKVFVANQGSNDVTVIEGSSDSASRMPAGTAPSAVAVNPVTNRAYVADRDSNDLAVLSEQPAQILPLITLIEPLPGDRTSIPQPTFSFSALSFFAPINPIVQNVYYQVDTRQGLWRAAARSGSGFSATTPVLQPGRHVLYAYATDGQEATSPVDGSPTLGNIAAYAFIVLPSSAATSITLSSNQNPALLNQEVDFTATVTSNAGTPTGTVTVYDGYQVFSSGPVDSAGVFRFGTASLGTGTHVITVLYGGDGLRLPGLSNTLYQVVNRYPTTTSLELTSGTNPSTPGTIDFRITITSQFAPYNGNPGGLVAVRDNGNFLYYCALSTPSCNIFINESSGTHLITADYQGDPTFAPSLAPPFMEVVYAPGAGGTTSLSVNGATDLTNVYSGVVAGVDGAGIVVTVDPNTAIGSVVLFDGLTQLGPILTLSSGQASTTARLPIGEHKLQAFYVGDGVIAGSASAIVTVERSPRPRPR